MCLPKCVTGKKPRLAGNENQNILSAVRIHQVSSHQRHINMLWRRTTDPLITSGEVNDEPEEGHHNFAVIFQLTGLN